MSKTIEEYSLMELMQKIEETVNRESDPIAGLTAIYQFDITGDEAKTCQLHFQNGKALVYEGEESPADCALIMSLASFQLFILGKLNGTLALMTGKLKIKGDMGKAIKIESILRQYNVKEHL
ncbi:SCP2 sterol-binding domain-containing protein [Bacillus sp. BRMEA1]|uniref:SCP2 sterol-binding domain-containing protein n=1 Tax=Neobacillus endophyticus TaxID=2738405 RepID=UPI0015639469|nr:SCP2 sterol-binding domain-containing protein [Neobacillus endophyticus]NRD78073.1 SCP2 sterol-binding domain-containing protein [Neobacillus endophyticus]